MTVAATIDYKLRVLYEEDTLAEYIMIDVWGNIAVSVMSSTLIKKVYLRWKFA